MGRQWEGKEEEREGKYEERGRVCGGGWRGKVGMGRQWEGKEVGEGGREEGGYGVRKEGRYGEREGVLVERRFNLFLFHR